MLRSILHWKNFPDNISKLFLAKKKKERMFSAHTTTVVNGGRQIWMDLDHVITKSLIQPPKNWKNIDVSFFSSSENLSTKKPSEFLESYDISNKRSDTVKRFQGTIKRHSGENFWLPGI